MKVAPCKDCDHREISCHSDCEEYKSWLDECHKLKESIEADRRVHTELMAHRQAVSEKIRRRHGYYN